MRDRDHLCRLGPLAPNGQIDAFDAAAHAAGVQVFPSLCGGGGDGRIAPHYQPAVVDAFVAKIIAFVEAHDLDGIDVDVAAPGRMGEAYDAGDVATTEAHSLLVAIDE